jgi:RNA polymerase sigma factor (sigma-70 family)
VAKKSGGEVMKEIDCLIKQNIGLMVNILKQYNLFRDPEAESIAFEALWRACEDYDESLGYKRSTLITIYVKRALGSYIRTLNKQRQIETISYNNIAYSDDGTDHEFLDLLSADESVEQQIMKDIFHQQVMEVYHEVAATLDGKKKAIIDEWEQSEFEATNKAIADATGVSQPYVNQVVATFKQRLRKRLKEDFYD